MDSAYHNPFFDTAIIGRERHLEVWKKTFPDPANLPASHAYNLCRFPSCRHDWRRGRGRIGRSCNVANSEGGTNSVLSTAVCPSRPISTSDRSTRPSERMQVLFHDHGLSTLFVPSPFSRTWLRSIVHVFMGYAGVTATETTFDLRPSDAPRICY